MLRSAASSILRHKEGMKISQQYLYYQKLETAKASNIGICFSYETSIQWNIITG